MPNVFIIHGAYGSPEENWFPWLKEELTKLGCTVFRPQFPTPHRQSLGNWLKVFEEFFPYLDEDSIVVGHSLGVAFLLTVIEKSENPIKTTFFVAGFAEKLYNEQLDELNKAGMAVQSHTMTHPLLGQLDSDEISKELMNSKRYLEERLSCSVDFISLPYGSYNGSYKKVAIDCGYRGGCTSDFGLVEFDCDQFLLNRIAVKSTYSLKKFRSIAEGNSFYFKKNMITKSLKKSGRLMFGEKIYNNIYKNVFGVKEDPN